MEKKRESFVIFKDWDNAIRKAPENIQLELYHALMDFVSTGIKPKNLSWEGEMLISAIENSVGNMIARYKACAENGKLGGRPRKASCKENLENTSLDEKNKFNAVESSISEKELVENMADKNALSSKDIEKSNVSEKCKKPESKKTSSVDQNNKNLETSENVKNSLNSKKTTTSKKEKNEKLEDVEIDVVKAERIKKDSKSTSKTNNENLKKDEIKADICAHEKELQRATNDTCHTKQAEKKCSESNPLHKNQKKPNQNQKKPNHNLNVNVNDDVNDDVDDDVDDDVNVDDNVNVDVVGGVEEQGVCKKDGKIKINNNNQLNNLQCETGLIENSTNKDMKVLKSLCKNLKIDYVIDTKKYDIGKLIQKVKESKYLKSFRSLAELLAKYEDILQDKYKDFAVLSLSSQNKDATKRDYSQEELNALFTNIEDVEI